jgi:hypothetical protein
LAKSVGKRHSEIGDNIQNKIHIDRSKPMINRKIKHKRKWGPILKGQNQHGSRISLRWNFLLLGDLLTVADFSFS